MNKISGESIRDLAPAYQELFDRFLNKKSKVVSLSEIHNILTPDKEFSMWATYKSISRFAKEIAPKYKVQNIKGKGYRLIQK